MDEVREVMVGDKDNIQIDFLEALVGEYNVEVTIEDPNGYIRSRVIRYIVRPKVQENK